MKPKVKQTKLLYSGFFDLRQDLIENHEGKTHPYTSLILSTDSVSILARTQEGKFICLKEYRHPTKTSVLGLPGGRLEQGEDPVKGGMRELLEETGYWSENVKVIGQCFPFPGVVDQRIFYLFADEAFLKTKPNLEDFEFLEVELKSSEELIQKAKDSSNVDGILCTALWYYSNKIAP